MFFMIYSEFFRGSSAVWQQLGPAVGPAIAEFVIIRTFCFVRERETAGRRRGITVYAGHFSERGKRGREREREREEIIIFNPSGALTIFGLLKHTRVKFL